VGELRRGGAFSPNWGVGLRSKVVKCGGAVVGAEGQKIKENSRSTVLLRGKRTLENVQVSTTQSGHREANGGGSKPRYVKMGDFVLALRKKKGGTRG